MTERTPFEIGALRAHALRATQPVAARRSGQGRQRDGFANNSANVNQRFRSRLVELAKCMNEGGLKGRKLLLVGHADPRGEEDYNLALGGRRAGSVHDALSALGVSPAWT